MGRYSKFHFSTLFLMILVFITVFSLSLCIANGFSIGSTSAEELGEEDVNIYDLRIYYCVNATTTEIYPHYHSQLLDDEEYAVASPTIAGYNLVSADDSVIEGVLTLDALDKDGEGNLIVGDNGNYQKTVYVYYLPWTTTAQYTVNHYTMEVNADSSITLALYKSITEVANVNEDVRVALESIPGYSWSVSDLLLTVTADGLAVKNLYYVKTAERLVIIRTGTGFVKTVSALPDADITTQLKAILDSTPTKAGFVFDGWDKWNEDVKDLPYAIVDGVEHIYMPDNDVVINAQWKSQSTAKYSVEFYFEKVNNTGSVSDPQNYIKKSSLDEVREGSVGDPLVPSEKDTLLADRYALFDIADVTSTACKRPDIFDGTKDDYIQTCPFFGFNFGYSISTTAGIEVDGSSVLKIYYTREDRVMNIWEYTNATGISDTDKEETVNNSIWYRAEGKFEYTLPSSFPNFSALEKHYTENKLVFCDASQKIYQRTVILVSDGNSLKNDGNFTITLKGETLQGTYTVKNDTSITFISEGNSVATATLTKSGDTYITIKVIYGGSTITFTRGYYRGVVEQNRAGTATTTQNPSAFRTGQDIICGELNFYPIYTTDSNLVVYSRVIYAMPDDFESWTTEQKTNIDIGSLNNIFKTKEGKATKNTFATISASAFTGYKNEGYFRVATTQEGLATATWQSIASSNIGPRCWGRTYNGVVQLCLETDDSDSYFQVLVKPKVSTLTFWDGQTQISSVQYDDNADGKTYTSYATSYFSSVNFNASLAFLSRIKLENTDEKDFDCWCYDIECKRPVASTDVCAEMSGWNVYARWISKTVKIVYDAMGGILKNASGNEFSEETIVVKNIETLGSPPTPTKANFKFMGWYTQGGEAFTSYNFLNTLHATKVLEVHAVWQPAKLVAYTVEHILQITDIVEGVEVVSYIELTQYTQTGYGISGSTITTSALTTGVVPANGVGYYISGPTTPTQTLVLTDDVSTNVSKFYYNEQDNWAYTVQYLYRDSDTVVLTEKVVAATDLLHVTERAQHIDGYAMIATDSEGNAIDGHRGVGYVSSNLSAGGGNVLKIYYDYLYDLVFYSETSSKMKSLPQYKTLDALYMETKTVPEAPSRAGYIFLGWNTQEDGAGTTYLPHDTYQLTQRASVSFYAMWAEVEIMATPGRYLNRVTADKSSTLSNDGIAQNGALTALYKIIDSIEDSVYRVKPNDFVLFSQNAFPQGTALTLIVYPNASGADGAQFYYFKVSADTQTVMLTDFVQMGGTTHFAGDSTKLFVCQVCVVYPNNYAPSIDSTNDVCISVSASIEDSTKVGAKFRAGISLPQPVGVGDPSLIEASANTQPAGQLSTTLTLTGLDALVADLSDGRNTSGSIVERRYVVLATLRDSSGRLIPFPEDSEVSLDGTIIKAKSSVKAQVAFVVTNGSYVVSATGLAQNIEHSIRFDVCLADSDNINDANHPNNIVLDSVSVNLAYAPDIVYAVSATLTDGEQVFGVPTETKVLKFDVLFDTNDALASLSVEVYAKGASTYAPIVDWTISITPNGDGKAKVSVSVPANTSAGTYRIAFTIGSATYLFNFVVIGD